MMGLAYMQPMTLFDTFLWYRFRPRTDGHVPTAYALSVNRDSVCGVGEAAKNWCVATLRGFGVLK